MSIRSDQSNRAPDESSQKDARIELRSTQSQKEMIERAASLMGESVTSYVLSAALEDASKVIHDREFTELSLADWNRFNALVNASPEPTEDLADALKAYRTGVVRSDGV